MKNSKKKNLIDIFIMSISAIFAFLLSWLISPYHVNGDQEHYTKAYELIYDANMMEAFDIYKSVVYSFEPLHFIISWCFSALGADKVLVMSGFNALLFVLYAKYLLIKTRNHIFILIILFSNYYIYTLFFTLEKLKFSAIFLLLFMIFHKKIFALASIFTHMQMAIPLTIAPASILIGNIKYKDIRKSIGLQSIIRFSPQLMMLVVFLLVFFDYGLDKLLYYSSREDVGDFSSLIPVFLIYMATVTSTNTSKIVATWFYIFLMFLVFMIGSDRINMIAYFGFLHFTSYRGNVFVASLIFSFIYLGYKSVNYINMIITFGG